MSIKCVFLKPTGVVVRCPLRHKDVTGEAKIPLYSTGPDSPSYHLGLVDAVDVEGRVWPPAPVGAMWHCDWLVGLTVFAGEFRFDRNSDGLILCVRTPGGDWLIDGQSWDPDRCIHGGGWSRTGTAPDVTVTPSIDIRGKYHGWLRNGYLEPA